MAKTSKTSSIERGYALWILLLQTRRVILKLREKELVPYDLTGSRAFILYLIDKLGNKATPAEISRLVFREPHSVSELLSRMEKKGLVKRVKDLGKKHQVRIAITDKGKKTYYHAMRRKSIVEVMSSLTDEEYQQLTVCLGKLRRKATEQLGVERELLPVTE